MPIVSVIIPTYKPREYLWKCLQSLRNQTLPSSDFEIILILNGCCEPYLSRINDYLLKSDLCNVRLFQTDESGVSNARNIGLDYAKGDYITFIDDDDYVSSTYLEELYAKASPDTISLCYPFAFKDGEYENQLPCSITDAYDLCVSHGANLRISSYVRKYFSGPWMKLIPRSFIQDRRFDIHFRNGEDTLFMFLISDRFSKFSFTSRSAVYYRRFRVGSSVHNKYSFCEKLSFCFRQQVCYIKYYISNPFQYNFIYFMSRLLGALTFLYKG